MLTDPKKSKWYLADVLRDPVEGETRLVCNDVQILANLLSGLSKIFNDNNENKPIENA
jgi:hypothetical protein